MLGACQISVVVPAVPVDCAARVHSAAPLWTMPVTALALALRVEMMATSVLPLVGAGIVTLKDVAEFAPVLPLA